MKNSRIEKILQYIYVKRSSYKSSKIVKKHADFHVETLDRSEQNEINKYWSNLSPNSNSYFHRLSKTLVGFDPRYLSEELYNPLIKAALNPAMQSVVFENKCLYDKFFPDVKRPKTICKNIMDEYYNEKDEYITIDQAIKLILANDSLVIKPGVYSDSGNSVKKFTPKDSNQIQNLFNKYSKNFIIQEVITQSDSTSIFNPESVNTLRVSSYPPQQRHVSRVNLCL